jgi:hypothetical protein
MNFGGILSSFGGIEGEIGGWVRFEKLTMSPHSGNQIWLKPGEIPLSLRSDGPASRVAD